MLERRALHDGFGDDSGRYGGAGSIRPSSTPFTELAVEQFIFTPTSMCRMHVIHG